MVTFQVHTFPELPSTQTYLREWAARETIPDGTLVWALHQTQGYGRKGSPWLSTPGESLTFTFVWTPTPPLQLLTPRVAVALYETVRPFVRERLFLKWPNDLWCPTGKLAGLLIELLWQGPTARAFIGIGLNVYQRHFPPTLRAVSLAQIGEPPPSLQTLLDRFLEIFPAWHAASPPEVVRAFLERLERKGQFKAGWSTWTGEIVGWDLERGLRLKTPDGLVHVAPGHLEVVWPS